MPPDFRSDHGAGMGQTKIFTWRWLLFFTTGAALIILVSCTSLPTTIPQNLPAPEPDTTTEPTEKPTPTDKVPRIAIEELLQKMDSGADILIVDTRTQQEYDVDHIKGAVSAPLSVMLEGHWAPPANKEIILYCA